MSRGIRLEEKIRRGGFYFRFGVAFTSRSDAYTFAFTPAEYALLLDLAAAHDREVQMRPPVA